MVHYVTPSLKVIGFEQLDPVYNRPDIVLDSIGKYFGGADKELVANYRQFWEKRINRLGLDKEKMGKGEIAVPNAEIVNTDNITYENKDGKLTFKVSANDPKYILQKFNIFINEVPVYGSSGISIANLKKQIWDTTITIPLSLGENKIQVSVMNELGLENFKYPTYVNYISKSTNEVSKTFYIGIGVDEFIQDEFKGKKTKLNYCVKDINDLGKTLKTGSNTSIQLFTNEQVTRENIQVLKAYLQNHTSVNDRVIISCSSHGILDKKNNFYLATHDIDFNQPEKRGIAFEELENLLDSIPARKKLLLLDACNSGENESLKNEKQEIPIKSLQDTNNLIASRAITKDYVVDTKSDFIKMNELFINVRNNTGSIIISAAGGQQSALEGEAVKINGTSLENGAFTYSILEYLNSNINSPEKLTVNQLKNYVEDRVVEITNGRQQPTSRQETMEIDWDLR